MRKIDKAFSDSLKTPGNVIPIQDVLLVRIEPLARYRPHAILAIRDNAYLSLRAAPSLSCYRLNVSFGTAILVPDDGEHFTLLSVGLDQPCEISKLARSVGRRPLTKAPSIPMIIGSAGLSGFRILGNFPLNKIWTSHERTAAQERALNERGKEYVLPIWLDNTPS
jgi:hypothetical protein